jgi:hypothetical protein
MFSSVDGIYEQLYIKQQNTKKNYIAQHIRENLKSVF